MRINCLVYLPSRHEDSPERQSAEARAEGIFGGFTWLPVCSGGWSRPECSTPSSRHPTRGWAGTDRSYREPMQPIMLAVDTLGDLALVVAYARAVGACYGEHSVYVQVGSLAELVQVNG